MRNDRLHFFSQGFRQLVETDQLKKDVELSLGQTARMRLAADLPSL